jgi:hypothetical protein
LLITPGFRFVAQFHREENAWSRERSIFGELRGQEKGRAVNERS